MKKLLAIFFLINITLSFGQNIAPNGYYTKGNKVFNESDHEIIFQGVNRPSLEWDADGNRLVEEDFINIANSCANIVRIPLNQQFWFENKKNYQATIDTVIKWCMKYDMHPILDLHWSQKNDPNETAAQQYHADEISVDFWKEVAAKYKNNGQVIFELYNEPHKISWNEIKYGGTHDNDTPSNTADDWTMVGYQDLYNAVRSTGAHNLVIVGGNDWSFDLSYYENDPINGYNIMYATHCYPYPNKLSDNWYKWTNMARKYPVIMTEFGPKDVGVSYLNELMDTMVVNNVHWTLWSWYDFSGNTFWNDFDPITQQYDSTDYAKWYFAYMKENVCNQNCPSPNLGNDLNLCGNSTLLLNSGLELTERQFSWKKNGVQIQNEKGTTLIVDEPGTYQVTTNENGCIHTDEIEVIKNFDQLDLGADRELCKVTEIELDAIFEGNGYTYNWSRNGEPLKEQTQTIIASKDGEYILEISSINCDAKTDTVIVSSSLVNVMDDVICKAGKVELEILENGNFEWYNEQNGGQSISDQSILVSNISQNTIFYVQDNRTNIYDLGEKNPVGNSNWEISTFDEKDKIYKVTVSQYLILESVDVFVVSEGTNVTINLQEVGGNTYSQTVTSLGSGKQTIQLGFELVPGVYTMDAIGTSKKLKFENSGASFPYKIQDIITFENSVKWQKSWYGFFYNWKINVSTSCSRTPVKATIDPSKCVTNLDNVNNADSHIFYPNPTQSTVYFTEEMNFVVLNLIGEILFSGKAKEVNLDRVSAPKLSYQYIF